MRPRIAPSILAADFANLERAIRQMEEAGAEMIHVDVMDGHFVPNLTIGLPVVKCIREVTDLHLDLHLMISNPDSMAVRFADAGANSITVHYEAAVHLDEILSSLKRRGVSAGVVLNPHTPVSFLEEILPKADMVLIMSVNPGYGGQEFIPTSFKKVRKLKNLMQVVGSSALVEIDGGIGPDNAREAVEAGVDILVAGTSVFRSGDPIQAFRTLRSAAESYSKES
jgi:ribulose-phosphate 3-epimerase